MKFEYLELLFTQGFRWYAGEGREWPCASSTEAVLGELGAEGWECFSVLNIGPTVMAFYLKRRIEEVIQYQSATEMFFGAPMITEQARKKHGFYQAGTVPAPVVEPTGLGMIAEERVRQVNGKGYPPEHDATHTEGELAVAAAVWATLGTAGKVVQDGSLPMWIWNPLGQPDEERVVQLAKAGALCAAEIDRLLARDKATQCDPTDPGD